MSKKKSKSPCPQQKQGLTIEEVLAIPLGVSVTMATNKPNGKRIDKFAAMYVGRHMSEEESTILHFMSEKGAYIEAPVPAYNQTWLVQKINR